MEPRIFLNDLSELGLKRFGVKYWSTDTLLKMFDLEALVYLRRAPQNERVEALRAEGIIPHGKDEESNAPYARLIFRYGYVTQGKTSKNALREIYMLSKEYPAEPTSPMHLCRGAILVPMVHLKRSYEWFHQMHPDAGRKVDEALRSFVNGTNNVRQDMLWNHGPLTLSGTTLITCSDAPQPLGGMYAAVYLNVTEEQLDWVK